jgi:hypothetical protein
MVADGVAAPVTKTGERGSASPEFLTLVMSCPSVSMGVVDGTQESVLQLVARLTSVVGS